MRKAISFIFLGNVLSKILGLSREIIIAALFGTGAINGAYRIAQTGTLVPINFLTSDSLNSAFIPLYKKYLLESKDKAQTLVWGISCLFFVFSVFLLCITIYLSGYWIGILAPGVSVDIYELSQLMLEVMALGIPFYIMSALVNYISMANDDFVPMSVRPSVQNIGMLLGALCSYYLSNPLYLAWGFTFSYVLFFFWTLVRAYKIGGLELPVNYATSMLGSIFLEFFKTLKPLILLPFLLQGNIAIERAVASLINLESVSAIDYARFVTETVLFMLSIPIAFAGLNSWSGLNYNSVQIYLVKIYSVILFLSVSISLFIGINATAIVRIIFERGQFSHSSVYTTSQILVGMSYGLWAQVIGYIFIKALNSQLMNKSVLKIMLFSLLGNTVVNLLLYRYWGPIVLGIGSSVYGIILMFSSAYYLGILKSLQGYSVKILLYSVGYYIVTLYINILNTNIVMDILVKLIIFTTYWAIAALTLKDFRDYIRSKL